jgi:hypothetical protein
MSSVDVAVSDFMSVLLALDARGSEVHQSLLRLQLHMFLVDLLSASTTAGVRAKAALLVASLSLDAAGCDSLISHGALDSLLNIIDQSDPPPELDVVVAALIGVRNLTAVVKSRAVVQPTHVAALFALLHLPLPDDAVDALLGALLNIFEHPPLRVAFVSPDVVRALAAALARDLADPLRAALSALVGNVASEPAARQLLIFAEGVLPPLIADVASARADAVVENAASAVANLCGDAESREVVVRSGALQALIKVVREGSSAEAVEAAATALSNACYHFRPAQVSRFASLRF